MTLTLTVVMITVFVIELMVMIVVLVLSQIKFTFGEHTVHNCHVVEDKIRTVLELYIIFNLSQIKIHTI